MDKKIAASNFWQWSLENMPSKEYPSTEIRTEASKRLVQAIQDGLITSLDGVDSNLSKSLMKIHGLDQFEMNSNWILTAQDWLCPCCKRGKIEISRRGNKNQILAKLVVHHDHMGEVMQEAFQNALKSAATKVEQQEGSRLVEKMGVAFAAYDEVLICEDCNNADAEAKKMVSASKDFSFSVGQISYLIKSHAHKSHVIDYDKAVETWNASKPAYELRMQLINTIAYAAATDKHWFDPLGIKEVAIPLFKRRFKTDDYLIAQWLSEQALIDALGPKRSISSPNLSRWRTISSKVGKSLPENYLAMLRTERAFANNWDSQSETWKCPVCDRNKFEIAYVGEKGRITFVLISNYRINSWVKSKAICNFCESIIKSLKAEINQLTLPNEHERYSLVTPEELSEIIQPRPHSQHKINSEKANALIQVILQRIKSNNSG
jgi:rubredoxin